MKESSKSEMILRFCIWMFRKMDSDPLKRNMETQEMIYLEIRKCSFLWRVEFIPYVVAFISLNIALQSTMIYHLFYGQ